MEHGKISLCTSSKGSCLIEMTVTIDCNHAAICKFHIYLTNQNLYKMFKKDDLTIFCKKLCPKSTIIISLTQSPLLLNHLLVQKRFVLCLEIIHAIFEQLTFLFPLKTMVTADVTKNGSTLLLIQTILIDTMDKCCTSVREKRGVLTSKLKLFPEFEQ